MSITFLKMIDTEKFFLNLLAVFETMAKLQRGKNRKIDRFFPV